MDPMEGICYQILLDTRSSEFLADFNQLFLTYPTENEGQTVRLLNFGDKILRIEEKPSNSTRKRSFVVVEN